MKYFIMFLAAFLISCGSPVTLAIDSRFTDHEIEILESAADEWVRATDSGDAIIFFANHFYYDRFTKDEWKKNLEYGLLFKISTTDQGYKELVKQQGGDFVGIASEHTGNIALRTDVIHEDYILRRVMMHELGHLYGLSHSARGLMGGHPDDKGENSDCIHAVDLERFCEKNYCGPNASPTCDL
jgi:hypothetical protein